MADQNNRFLTIWNYRFYALADMRDYKNLNPHRRAADRPRDGFLSGISLFIAVFVLLFYVLALVPAKPEPSTGVQHVHRR